MRTAKEKTATTDWQELALKRLEGIQKRCKCGACDPPKPKLPPGMHRLKVQPKYVERSLGPNTYVPQISLTGEWLRKTGFDCQTHVIVTKEPGRLVIQLETA